MPLQLVQLKCKQKIVPFSLPIFCVHVLFLHQLVTTMRLSDFLIWLNSGLRLWHIDGSKFLGQAFGYTLRGLREVLSIEVMLCFGMFVRKQVSLSPNSSQHTERPINARIDSALIWQHAPGVQTVHLYQELFSGNGSA